jgi:Kef-type K+ transport system membrane component KefB
MAAAGADDAVAWCLLLLVVSLIHNPSKIIGALYVFLLVIGFGAFLWICIRPIFNYLVCCLLFSYILG